MNLNKKIFSIILGFSILINNFIHSAVVIDDIRNEKLLTYKKEISDEIIRDKFIAYIIVGASAGLIGLTLYQSLFTKSKSSVDKGPFNEDEIQKLRELAKLNPEITIDGKIKFSPTQKVVNFFSPSGMKNFILANAYWSGIATLGQRISDKFLKQHNLEWILSKTSIPTAIVTLKELAVSLDPKTEIIKFEKLDLNQAATSASELVKLNILAKTVLANPLSQQQITNYIMNVKLLSNKIVDDVTRIIAFLNYKEEYLISQDKFSYLYNLRYQVSEFKKILSVYREDIKNILNELMERQVPTRSLLGTIITFQHSFNQIFTETYTLFSRIV